MLFFYYFVAFSGVIGCLRKSIVQGDVPYINTIAFIISHTFFSLRYLSSIELSVYEFNGAFIFWLLLVNDFVAVGGDGILTFDGDGDYY